MVGPVEDSGTICELFFLPSNQGQLYASPTPGVARVFIDNVRATVNVKPVTGTAYTAYVQDPKHDIHLGDTWPP
jgi:hypothetical protein